MPITAPEPKLILEDYTSNRNGRFIQFSLFNKHLLENVELAEAIYHFLFNNKIFLNFGEYKIIIISAKNEENDFNYHPNTLVNNNTTFAEYYNKIRKDVIVRDYAYGSTAILYLTVTVWNVDDMRNKKIKVTRNASNRIKLIKSTREYSTSTKPVQFVNRNIIKPYPKKLVIIIYNS